MPHGRTGANWLATLRVGAVRSSDRGRAQRLAPMLNPFFQRALASVSQLLEVDLLEDPEGETFGCGAKTALFAHSLFA